jgi:hypothetical protein
MTLTYQEKTLNSEILNVGSIVTYSSISLLWLFSLDIYLYGFSWIKMYF